MPVARAIRCACRQRRGGGLSRALLAHSHSHSHSPPLALTCKPQPAADSSAETSHRAQSWRGGPRERSAAGARGVEWNAQTHRHSLLLALLVCRLARSPIAMTLSPALGSAPRSCTVAITAVEIVADGSCVLAAAASTLRLYALTSNASGGGPTGSSAAHLLAEVRVFNGQRIHGLRVLRTSSSTAAAGAGRCLLAVFGGKEMAIWQLDEAQAMQRASAAPSSASATPDATPEPLLKRLWTSPTRDDIIWDAHFLRCTGDATAGCFSAAAASAEDFDLAVGYAHDRIEVLSFRFESSGAAASSRSLVCAPSSSSAHGAPLSMQCADRSLLYSMCMHGLCRHRLMVVGGTVFSHILLWDASEEFSSPATAAAGAGAAASSLAMPAHRPQPLTRPVLHRLTGHEGVIFRVQCSVDAAVIASVSDDRSMRVWRWTATAPSAAASSAASASAAAASSSSSILSLPWGRLVDPLAGSFVCTVTAYGHKARVWRCIMPHEWNVVITAVSPTKEASAEIWAASRFGCASSC